MKSARGPDTIAHKKTKNLYFGGGLGLVSCINHIQVGFDYVCFLTYLGKNSYFIQSVNYVVFKYVAAENLCNLY